jgi:genome maintenance exonuclease 1
MFEHVEVDLGYDDLDCTTSETGRVYLHPREGREYPSITTVLKVLSDEGIKKWRERVGEEEANKISYRASQRGTAVHELIEKYIDNNENYTDGYMPNIVSDFLSVKPILDSRIGKVYAQEVPLFSDHLGVAGRVDCVAEFDGKLSIIDFKTSRKVKLYKYVTNYFQQEAFYAVAWEERTGTPITQLVTIIAVDNEDPQVFIEHRDDWVDELKETIKLYHEKM